MGKFQDKVAIVTGSSKGIGLGVARALSAEGAKVVICSRHEEDGIPVAKELGSEEGRAVFIKCDVSDLASIKNLIDVTIQKFGRLDILVNNAGKCNYYNIDQATEEEFEFTINTDLRSQIFCCKYALPYLRETKGNIINMSSMGWMNGAKNQIIYNTAKGGNVAFTKSLAAELAPEGIRVNSIAPGLVDTDDARAWVRSQGDYEAVMAMICNNIIPLGRFGTIDEIGETAVFLAGCNYITGSTIVVDGGVQKY